MEKGLLAVLTLLTGACAFTAPRTGAGLGKLLQMTINVEGRWRLDEPNLTYYLVLNAPASTVEPTDGPRVNGPDLTKTREFLEGRLPFVGQLPTDLPTVWTDFYFVNGTLDGKGRVGRGAKVAGLPLITDENYIHWRLLDPSRLQIDLYLDQLAGSGTYPPAITANLAVSDSYQNGYGMIFDRWQNNVPFRIATDNTNQRDRDINPFQPIVLPPAVGAVRPAPTLPNGVAPADANITGYEVVQAVQ